MLWPPFPPASSAPLPLHQPWEPRRASPRPMIRTLEELKKPEPGPSREKKRECRPAAAILAPTRGRYQPFVHVSSLPAPVQRSARALTDSCRLLDSGSDELGFECLLYQVSIEKFQVGEQALVVKLPHYEGTPSSSHGCGNLRMLDQAGNAVRESFAGSGGQKSVFSLQSHFIRKRTNRAYSQIFYSSNVR